MATRTYQVPVAFAGVGCGTGPLTWGQQGIWETMLRTGRTMNIGGVMPLPPGETVEGIELLLRFLVSRHQALRTRLRLVPDGPPLQVVEESGEVGLDVVEVGGDDDPATVAEDLRTRYEFTPFDHVRDWPVRMGVVRRDGVLTHFVVQYSHLSVDGFGIEAVVRDLANLDRETGSATAPVDGVPPLDQARQQQTPAGRRQSDRALRYWENLLRTVPSRRFRELARGTTEQGTGSADPRGPRFRSIVCRSPAMHLAVRAIADRTRVGTGPVLLAAYAVTLARVTGLNPSVAQVLVSNRFRPGFAESVSHLTQPGLCVIDVADCTVDDAVRRAWKSATGAYLHGYYDTVAVAEMLARMSRERAEPIDISCYVNDRRNKEQAAGPSPAEADLRAALPLTTVFWDRTLDTYDGTFYLHIDPAPDAVEVTIWADTHHLSPADIEACAWGLEAVVVEAAFDPNMPTGVSARTAPV